VIIGGINSKPFMILNIIWKFMFMIIINLLKKKTINI